MVKSVLSTKNQPLLWVGLFIWSAFVVIISYGDAVTLPFFFDDLVQIPHASQHSLIEAWQADGGSAYYRPLGATIWKISYQLLGKNSAPLQHTINLLLHWVNGVLVAYLAELIWQKNKVRLTWRGGLSATLFVLFPFSYQAIPWVGALFHLLVTALILGSLICFLHFQRNSRFGWAIGGFFLALLAPFAHENGVLIAPFVIMLMLFGNREANGRFKLALFAWILPALIWLPIWRSITASGSKIEVVTLETIIQNSAYFAQGVAYPFTGFGRKLMDQFGWNDLVTAVAISLLTFLIMTIIQWRTGKERQMLFLWLWIIASSLPVILFLSFGYVISGSRLLMLPSVGIAWLWADVVVRIGKHLHKNGRKTFILKGALIGLCILLFTHNYSFIRQRMLLHLMLGDAVNQAATIAEQSSQKVTFVNLPSWAAPKTIIYPLGHEGVLFFPDYIAQEQLINAQLQQPEDFYLLKFTDLQLERSYYYGTFGKSRDWPIFISSGGPIYLTTYGEETTSLQLVGDFSIESSDQSPLATFTTLSNNGVIMLQSANAILADEKLSVEFHWQIQSEIEDDVIAFVHLIDESGQLVDQADGYALAGIYPMMFWPQNASVQDVRYFQLDGIQSDNYQLYVGLYNRINGERLIASNQQGETWRDNAVSVPIKKMINE